MVDDNNRYSIDNGIYGRDKHQDTASLPNRENFSQVIEIRNIHNRNGPACLDGLAVSVEILSGEMTARLSQEKDSLMNLLQLQI